MNRSLHHAVFLVGLSVVCWVGAGYGGSNLLALAITVIIGAFYGMGAFELHRFHQATSTLTQAVDAKTAEPLPSLDHWLGQVHPSLRSAVRLRVEGERVGLPGPALTPYLTGLLVLLGMLGTFLGMVVTLNGTGMALDGSTDLRAIRESLSAPVKGLGLAFGTSVAGVAASAMLGLMSTLCRRERLQAAQALDAKIATSLRVFSLAHQREESLKLLQRQAQVMPDLVDRLQTMMATMERQSQALNERLLASQDTFYDKAQAAYADLAASVDRSLQASLTESARMAAATIQPVVEATMAGIARETASLHDTLGHTVQRHIEGMSTQLEATTSTLGGLWKTALADHQRGAEAASRDLRAALEHFTQTFGQRSASLVDDVSARIASLLNTVSHAQAQCQADMASHEQQRLAAWSQALESMTASLKQEWQQAGAQALEQQQQVCTTLEQTARSMAAQSEAHAKNTITEIAQLVQAASEAPRAAADVISELRHKLADSMARDNVMLEERSRILETLNTLLNAVNHASTEQRGAIDALVASSEALLDRVGARFSEQVDTQAEKMSSFAAQITGSAVEVASLGEALGFAVQLFSESNDKLMAHLQRVESALSKSISRSDEQLAYYVAQAREVIDLSIMSQKQIVEDLQQFATRQALAGSEA